jgi:hypothetical protein
VADQTSTALRPQLEGAAIVLVGNFNPPIFQPAWFAAKKLLPDAEVEEAADVMITSDIASFTAEWLTVQVMQQRFQAATADPSKYGPLLDLVVGTFTFLEHTPFNKAGLNHQAHYALPSEEKWHAFGDLLAPKPQWSSLFEGRVGMRSLTVEGRRAGCEAKYIRASVEPSNRVTPNGVYFAINEHYEAEGPEASKGLLDTLKRNWEESGRFADAVQKRLLSQNY